MNKLPETFPNSITLLPTDELPLFFESLSEPSPVSIRVNPDKCPIVTELDEVPWCPEGLYLPERTIFTTDPLFHAGAYYVQEASSMFLHHALTSVCPDPADSFRILDLCGAPGGKSTLISSFLRGKGLLVTNEVIQARSQVLAENIMKWGQPNTIVTNNDPSVLGRLQHFFDVVVTDAPCSGEGMFRKDMNARNEWSPAHVDLCSQRQKRIISDIWEALKPGAYMIYSTCTFNVAENEEVAAWTCSELGATSVPVPIPAEWQIIHSNERNIHGYRFYPHKIRGEGFFLTVLQKNDGLVKEPWSAKKKKRTQPAIVAATQAETNEVLPWLKPAFHKPLLKYNDRIIYPAVENAVLDFIMEHKVRLRSVGLDMAEVKKKNMVPQHGLALSVCLNREAFPCPELSQQEAVNYLMKGEAEPHDNNEGELPNGWFIPSFQRMPLGFSKKIGARYNNYYPKEWRIQKRFTPQEYFTLSEI